MPEIVLEKDEFYNPDFSPSLRQLAWSNFRSSLRPWKFHDRGVPAPTLTGCSAAYWLASVRSKDNELPILALTSPNNNEPVNTLSNNWFAGIVSVRYIQDFKNDPGGLHRACLESAMSGPASLNYILQYFDKLVTAETVVLPETVEQFSVLLNKN